MSEKLPAWWPVCGTCGQIVDRFAWTADPAAPKTMTLRIECHGKVETTVCPTQAAGSGASMAAFQPRKPATARSSK